MKSWVKFLERLLNATVNSAAKVLGAVALQNALEAVSTTAPEIRFNEEYEWRLVKSEFLDRWSVKRQIEVAVYYDPSRDVLHVQDIDGFIVVQSWFVWASLPRERSLVEGRPVFGRKSEQWPLSDVDWLLALEIRKRAKEVIERQAA